MGDSAITKSALHSFIQSALPTDARCSTEFRDLGALALQRFYDVLIAQALEGAQVDGSPLLKPSHITDALKTLGFDSYIAQVEIANEAAAAKIKLRNGIRRSSQKRKKPSPEEEEALIALQRAKFAAARGKSTSL